MADKESDKIFKNTIRNEAYDFLKNKNLKFYSHSNSIAQMTYYTPIATFETSAELKKVMTSGYFENAYNAEKLLHAYSYYNHDLMPNFKLVSIEDQKRFKEEFFIHSYNKYPEYQKLLLANYTKFKVIDTTENEDHFFNIIDLVAKTKKEKAQTLAKFPISSTPITIISLEKIQTYLRDNDFTKEEIDKFLLSYLKARKNQLKDARTAEYAKEFLINKYNDEQLQPYCDFFPFLKSLFELPPVDFIRNQENLSTVIIVECKKMKDSFLLSGWNVDNYQTSLKPIIKALCTKYNLSKGYSTEFDKSQIIEQIIFLHDNPEFTKKVFEEDVTKFFTYMHQNVDTNTKKTITSDDVLYYFNTWLVNENLYNKLSTDIPNKDSVAKKKI